LSAVAKPTDICNEAQIRAGVGFLDITSSREQGMLFEKI